MYQAVQHQPAGNLTIQDGYAAIPAWGWDSTQDTILGIPVLADVNMAMPMIPDDGQIKPGLYLTFTNGWVLVLNTPFSSFREGIETPTVVFGTAYIGEGNHIFDRSSLRTIQRNLGDLAVLEATIREVANMTPTSRDDLIAKYIAPDPHRPGINDAILANSGVHVWAIIGAILLAGASPDEVSQDYNVPREAVEAALAYYRRYRPVIDARIAANNVGAA